MIYWLIFSLILGYSFYELYSKDMVTKKIFLLVVYSSILLLRGLRWDTGTDWLPYLSHFRNPQSVNFEFGYEFIVKAVRLVTKQYTWFLLVINGTILFIINRSLSLIGTNKGLFLLLYFTGSALFPVRQHLAGALLFLVFAMIVKNSFKTRLKLFNIFIAFSIHLTALLGNILMLLESRSKWLVPMIGILSCLIIIVYQPFYFERIIKRYVFYSQYEMGSKEFPILSFTKALVFLFLFRILVPQSRRKKHMIFISLVYISINYIIGYYFGEFGRLSSLFLLIYLLMVAELFNSLLRRAKRNISLHAIYFSQIMALSISDFYSNLYQNRFSDLLIPYIHVWSDVGRGGLY